MQKWVISLATLLILGNVMAEAGTISGTVVFKGTPPPPRKVSVSTDPEICGSEQQAEDLVVGANKGIKYAVVRVMGADGAPLEAAQVVPLDQKGCKFNPHVVVMQKGTSLDILNNDGISHNLHTHSTANPAVNKAQPGFRKKLSQAFEKAENIKVTCDVHPWMAGWIVVAENGLIAVTDDAGSFKLENVPAGTYQLEVWHEKLGTQTKQVTVGAAGDASASFELGSS